MMTMTNINVKMTVVIILNMSENMSNYFKMLNKIKIIYTHCQKLKNSHFQKTKKLSSL